MSTYIFNTQRAEFLKLDIVLFLDRFEYRKVAIRPELHIRSKIKFVIMSSNSFPQDMSLSTLRSQSTINSDVRNGDALGLVTRPHSHVSLSTEGEQISISTARMDRQGHRNLSLNISTSKSCCNSTQKSRHIRILFEFSRVHHVGHCVQS